MVSEATRTRALERVETAAQGLAASKRDRDDAIRAAILKGVSQVAIARAASLSRARVQQIIAGE